MSQGPRGGWARKLVVGIGAALCVAIVGCNEIDKPRLGSGAKQPAPGLPGTPTLSGQPGTGNVRTGPAGMTTQPIGSAGTSAGRSPTGAYSTGGNTSFGTNTGGAALAPSVNPTNPDYQPMTSGPISPAAGMGAAGGSFGGAPAPSLDAPGLTPPASPGASGGIVAPAGSAAPVAPINK